MRPAPAPASLLHQHTANRGGGKWNNSAKPRCGRFGCRNRNRCSKNRDISKTLQRDVSKTLSHCKSNNVLQRMAHIIPMGKAAGGCILPTFRSSTQPPGPAQAALLEDQSSQFPQTKPPEDIALCDSKATSADTAHGLSHRSQSGFFPFFSSKTTSLSPGEDRWLSLN